MTEEPREVFPQQLVGRRIAKARDAAGLTQEQLGEKLGRVMYHDRAWPKQAVSAAERGLRDFSALEIVAFAIALERPPGWFFRLEPDEDILFPFGPEGAIGHRPRVLTPEEKQSDWRGSLARLRQTAKELHVAIEDVVEAISSAMEQGEGGEEDG